MFKGFQNMIFCIKYQFSSVLKYYNLENQIVKLQKYKNRILVYTNNFAANYKTLKTNIKNKKNNIKNKKTNTQCLKLPVIESYFSNNEAFSNI